MNPVNGRSVVVAIVLTTIAFLLVFVYLTDHLPNSRVINIAHTVIVQNKANPDDELRYGYKRTDNTITVLTTGKFLTSVSEYNKFLHDHHALRLKSRDNASVALHQRSQRCIKPPIQLIWGADDDNLERLSHLPHIETVYLPWRSGTDVDGDATQESQAVWDSRTDFRNVLVQDYYDWTADSDICTIVETAGGNEFRYEIIFNFTCSRDENSMAVRSLKPIYLNTKRYHKEELFPPLGQIQPAWTYERPPPFVTYLHIITNGLITSTGEVILEGGIKYAPFTCHADTSLNLPNCSAKYPVYDFVFVITQHSSWNFFHRLLEALPRALMYLDFLRSNPHIVIHALDGENKRAQLREYFNILGIRANPIVTGIVSASTIYLPRSTPCHTPNVQEIQLLSKRFRDYIVKTFRPVEERKTIILIRRTRIRWFVKQSEIEKVLQKVAQDFNLTYYLFIDNPAPSLNETMSRFHSAVLIVAPHGAGLSNIIFTPPGAYVIEAVNKPFTNLCFARTAHILGHRWHGLLHKHEPGFLTNRQISVPVSKIDEIARKFMTHRLHLKNDQQ